MRRTEGVAGPCADGKPLGVHLQWNVDTALSEQPEIGELSPIGLPPTAAELAAAAAQR